MRRSAGRGQGFDATTWTILVLAPLVTMVLCVGLGSVAIPPGDTMRVIVHAVTGQPAPEGIASAVILPIRLPRVLGVALSGAALSLCGAAMQGLLRNPLADGSTLGVSSGAALGAVVSLAFGVTVPGFPLAGTMGMAMLFAFGSLMLILSLAYILDRSLATHSIILIGGIFSMFVSSMMNLVISFAGNRVQSITFWTMGSLQNCRYTEVLVLLAALVLLGGVLLSMSRELNSFAGSYGAGQHEPRLRAFARPAGHPFDGTHETACFQRLAAAPGDFVVCVATDGFAPLLRVQGAWAWPLVILCGGLADFTQVLGGFVREPALGAVRFSPRIPQGGDKLA